MPSQFNEAAWVARFGAVLVVVDYSLPDVRDLIVSVERWVDGRPSSVIWQPEADDGR